MLFSHLPINGIFELRNPIFRMRCPSLKPTIPRISYQPFSTSIPKPITLTPAKRQLLPNSVSVKGDRMLFSTSSVGSIYNNRPPRFNRGPPSSPLGVFWYLVPDGLKVFLAITGFASMFFLFALPLLIIVVPPLFIGGFVMSRLYLRQRNRKFTEQRHELMNTSLVYKGDPLNPESLRSFVKHRIVEALEVNEKNIIQSLHLGEENGQHHTLLSRFTLTDIESIDQNFNFSNLNPQLPLHAALNDSITTISLGLLDRDSKSSIDRVGTVVVSLKQKNVRSLLDLDEGMDSVIEIKPLLSFSNSVILNTPSSFFDQDQIFEIKKRRTRNY